MSAGSRAGGEVPRTRGERERVEGGRESFTLKVVRRRLEATRCEGKEKEKKEEVSWVGVG